MSVIYKATLEQTTEALYQTTRSEILGKWAWQAFIEQGSKMGFEYLIKKIARQAKDSLNCDPYDHHEATLTHIAIVSVLGEPYDQIRITEDSIIQQLESMIELATLTKSFKDINEVRRLVALLKDKLRVALSSYYLVKTYLLFAHQSEVKEKKESVLIDCAIDEAKKIKDPFFNARAIAEIYKIRQDGVGSFLDKAAQKDTEDEYLNSRIGTLNLYRNSAPWLFEAVRRSAGHHGNPRQAESFMAIASIAKTPFDLECAYKRAEEIADEKPHKIWCSLIRIYAGID